jgi:hypothetical protein
MIALKLRYKNFKFFYFFLVLSLLTLVAPNRKGQYIILILSFVRLILLYKNIKFSTIFNYFLLILLGIGFTFGATYILYYTAGEDVDILNKIYMYITGPIAGTGFLQFDGFTSILEIKSFNGIFDKLNILEYYNISKHADTMFIKGINIGNVNGIFGNYYKNFGLIGPILFILLTTLFLRVFESTNKNIVGDTFYVIVFTFIDLSFFGNYFEGAVFIEIIAAFILYSFVYIIIRQASLLI